MKTIEIGGSQILVWMPYFNVIDTSFLFLA